MAEGPATVVPDAGPTAPIVEGIVVDVGDVQVAGARGANRIAATINGGAWESTKACVATNGFLPMTATLVIDASGRVISAVVVAQQTEPFASALGRCVSAALSALNFRSADSEARVTVSLARTGPKVVFLGSLDKEIIRRIVQEHAAQIRYCYEKELTQTPGIHGKIKMKWVIDGEGRVMQAETEETQMKNANVESCLAMKIKTWVFPKPKGGGIVIVSYPFVFKQSQ